MNFMVLSLLSYSESNVYAVTRQANLKEDDSIPLALKNFWKQFWSALHFIFKLKICRFISITQHDPVQFINFFFYWLIPFKRHQKIFHHEKHIILVGERLKYLPTSSSVQHTIFLQKSRTLSTLIILLLLLLYQDFIFYYIFITL